MTEQDREIKGAKSDLYQKAQDNLQVLDNLQDLQPVDEPNF